MHYMFYMLYIIYVLSKHYKSIINWKLQATMVDFSSPSLTIHLL